MADAEQLGFAFVVEDEASTPLGDIEDSYLSLMKTMDKFNGKMSKSTKDYSESLGDAAEAAEDAGEAEEGQTGKLQEATDALKENALGLDQFGLSWNQIIKGLTAVSIGAAIVGIVAFFKKAFDAAVQYRSELAKLNEAYAMSAKESAIVSSTVLSLADRAGKTREEVLAMTKAMLDIGLTPAAAKAAGTSFRALAKDSLDLSAATGVGMEAAVGLTDQLIRINKVPANRIRNIGYSIKSVADQTRISSDELVQFNKSLEPLYSFLTDQSGEARAKFTQEMTGIAGALSDVGIDATQATSQLADMLDETSESGAKALGQLATFTRRSTTQLREMIKNDPTAIFNDLAKSAGAMDPSQLKLMSRSLQPLGLGFAELTRLSGEFGKEGSKSFKDRVTEITKMEAKDSALTKAAQKRQSAIEAIQSKFSRMWENAMIRIGGAISDKLAKPLMDKALPAIERLIDWIANVDWQATFQTMFDVIDFVIDAIDVLRQAFKYTFGFIGEGIGLAMSNIVDAVKAAAAIFSGDWEKAGMIVVAMFENIGAFLGKYFGKLAKMMVKPVTSAFEFIQDAIDRIILFLGKKLAPMLEKFVKYIPGGASIVGALKSAGQSAERRVAERERRKEEESPARGSTVTQAIQPGMTGGVSVQAGAVNMPGQMKTADPVTQQLLRENIAVQKDIRDEMRFSRRRGGGSASAAKNDMVRRNAGG